MIAYSARNIGQTIAQICHMRMLKINPFLFSSPCILGIKGDCWIGWEVAAGLRLGKMCPRLSPALLLLLFQGSTDTPSRQIK
jgi:hypothetical protein